MTEDTNSSDSSPSRNTRSSRERKNSLKRALQQTIGLQEVINDSTINKLDEVVNKADDITNETSTQEKVNNQQEVLIDSEMMTLSSKILKTCTNTLTKRMCDYNYIDFAQKLINHLEETSDNSQSPNWSVLEMQVTKLIKRMPNYSTLLGTLEPLEKKVIVRKKPQQRILSQAAMKVPDKLVPQANTKDEDSVERTVRKIKKLIACYYKETRKPIDLFQLILHPDDFGRTIRNLLYISFLVKDGVVKLKKNNRGSLVVEPCHKQANSQNKESNKNKTGSQNVISLNMDQWMILKRAYKVQEPMIDFDEDK
ncbi:EP300-interacting inhibitor of differentiation 3 [Linepithema humile]|uniref:EP300-interacting inhibitor of differentiation 3 n=1 Tax=Linepithema humile TaxID=83485 RepID=UPI0006232C8F|nr:PREDICTED: EP300-interacting inhibitor of differentiation 3-like [Linepithema humile]